MKTLAYPLVLPRPPRVKRIPPTSSVDPVELSATVGKGITLWVLFTSSLNWLYYRNKTKK